MGRSRVKKPEPIHQLFVPEPKALTQYQCKIVGAPWFDHQGVRMIHTFCKARQIGGSEAASMRALCFALGRRILYNTGNPDEDGDYVQEIPMSGIVVSSTWAKSKELLAKVTQNIREWAASGDQECQAALAHCHDTKIFFPTTGTEIKAVACSPIAVRGSTGFVIMDEFAFARSQEDLWGAAKFLTEPNLGSPSGRPMLVVSTAWEAGSFAHRIFTDPNFPFAGNRFQTDIYQAKEDGFPIDIERAFADLGIEELIETEYLCKWTRGGESFFSADKLRACTVDDDPDSGDDKLLGGSLPLFYSMTPCRIGIDCGGGVGRDFTAAVMWRQIAGKWWMCGVKASNKKNIDEMAEEVGSWLLDKEVVSPTVQIDVRCDRNIMGADFIRKLRTKLTGRDRTNIIGVGMSNPEQETYALAGRRLLERGQMVIYEGVLAGGDSSGAHALMLELGKIKARKGQGGHIAFSTPRDPLKGHCDRAWAGLMGLEGADADGSHSLSESQKAKLYYDFDSNWVKQLGPGEVDDSRGFG